jgi:flagellar basal body-associated protein FliL
MTKKEEESLKKEIVKELKPFLEKEIQKVVKDKFTDDEIKKVTVKTLTNLFKVLWNRKGTWSDAV